MPQRTLRFKIRQDGFVEETVEGIVGHACHKLTENLEATLGSVEKRALTSEAYLNPEDQAQLIQEKLNLI